MFKGTRCHFVAVKALLADVLAVTNRKLEEASMVGRDVNLQAKDTPLLIGLLGIARHAYEVGVAVVLLATKGVSTEAWDPPIGGFHVTSAVACCYSSCPFHL